MIMKIISGSFSSSSGGVAPQFLEGGGRRLRVGDEINKDRNDIALSSELEETLKTWNDGEIGHRLTVNENALLESPGGHKNLASPGALDIIPPSSQRCGCSSV